MKRPFKDARPVGPFAQDLISDPDPDPEGSMVIARLDLEGVDETNGKVDPEFQGNMVNVIADAVAEATQSFGGATGASPINFESAIMFQPFPVSVGQEFQKAILAMMYDENLVRSEANIERNIDARTDRVQRFDVFPL